MDRVSYMSPQPFDQQPYCYQYLDGPQENWHESEEEKWSAIDAWEDFLKEVDVEGHEMIKEFVSKVEENVPFEQMLREAWHHFRGKLDSHKLENIARKLGREGEGDFVMRDRGLDLEGEELKNERFKVKTMNVTGSGVVEEGKPITNK